LTRRVNEYSFCCRRSVLRFDAHMRIEAWRRISGCDEIFRRSASYYSGETQSSREDIVRGSRVGFSHGAMLGQIGIGN
jgi:hypothetical protein